MALDKHLANEVRKREKELREQEREKLNSIPVAAIIDYLREKGYEVKLEGTCSTCGQLIIGPHFCPGPPGSGDHEWN